MPDRLAELRTLRRGGQWLGVDVAGSLKRALQARPLRISRCLEPGTTAWWLSRPVWVAVLAVVASGLVATFARYEWRVSKAPPPRSRRWVTLGVVLTAGSAAAVAAWGITGPDAVIHWSIPGAAVVGAAILGALPRRKKITPQTQEEPTRPTRPTR